MRVHRQPRPRAWQAELVGKGNAMTDHPGRAALDAMKHENGYLIHKDGRGWYRPNAQGYTSRVDEAGRYTRDEALSYSHPNGWSVPRDEITVKHESEIEEGERRPLTPAEAIRPGKAALAAIMEAAEKVAGIRADYDEFDGDKRGIHGALIDARSALVSIIEAPPCMTNASAYVASLEAENKRLRAELAAAKAATDTAGMAERKRCAEIATRHDFSLQSTTEADIRARRIAAAILGDGNGA